MISIGIDTSNYTTSVAAAEEGKLLCQKRQLLSVKAGEKGLRQSDALFQHWNRLPELLSELFKEVSPEKIGGICVSTRPRNHEGSYMPVFTAGYNIAKVLSAALNVPMYELSHQDGHIIAASYENNIDFTKPLVCAHLSGGTLEFVLLKDGKLSIAGGTRDISYGKLIDRIGVDMGFPFPAGKYIDEAALRTKADEGNPFCNITVKENYMNLSGIETQLVRVLASSEEGSQKRLIPVFLMERICESFVQAGDEILKQCGAEHMLVSGGVACSVFLRKYCEKHSGYIFGKRELCSDNAAGIALSGGKLPWQ